MSSRAAIPGTTQIFAASTAFGLATLAAAIEDGLYPRTGRRILITSNNAAVPETSAEIADVAGTESLLALFDDVFSYNDAVRPQHPSVWRPRAADLPIWQRHLQQSWALGDGPLHLIVESIQGPPSMVLALTFNEAQIDVYADGLMSYGPTRIGLPAGVAARIERLVHLDLVPGVTPLLLSEFDVPAVRVSDGAFTKIIDGLGTGLPRSGNESGATAVLLGQYLSAAELVTVAEEQALYADMVRGAAMAGISSLIFKPHPSAPPSLHRALTAEAAAYGAQLRIETEPTLVETWYRCDQVGLVVGCFSTGLLTAASLYGLPVARVGTSVVLQRLKPYENSNRVPVALVDALVPSLESCHSAGDARSVDPARTAGLLRGVAYGMQPARYPGLRSDAEQLWAGGRESAVRYLGRGRAAQLGLPGARRTRHPLKRWARSVLGPQTYSWIGRRVRRLQQVITAAKDR